MKLELKPMKEFCNLAEKELLKAPMSALAPFLLFIAHRDNLNFYPSMDGRGFITTAHDFKLVRKKLLNEVQNN